MSFKSLVDGVTLLSHIEDKMQPALSYQYMFEKKTSPWEMSQWDQDELQQFTVKVTDIDRLYYIFCSGDGGSDATFYMLAGHQCHRFHPHK